MVKASGNKVTRKSKIQPKRALQVDDDHSSDGRSFPIVGIGASAGGLEALEQFLSNVPEKSNIAFVVVQHLDPTREDAMADLLGRITKLEVVQAKDHQEIRPNTAYIIPPNKTMSGYNGKLFLFEPVEPRFLRFPIDFFLRSLAEDQQESAIAVILSGMGSDGTLGVQAIRERSGLVLVQSPETAKFSGMPRSVIEAGLADIVAPANELPGIIMSHLKRYTENGLRLIEEKKDKSAIEKILILLRMRTGNDFSLYKRSTIYRRVERRMLIHKIDKISSYVRYLQESNKETDILYKELFIGVTSFFRDPGQWEILKRKVIPAILEGKSSGYVLRAWVAGCSTGEEAYSLAMTFRETIEIIKPKNNFTMQIFATDIDVDAINKARKGIYPVNITNDVSESRLNRFFIKTENAFRINAEIREMVVFAPQNILLHPPFTKLDLLTCRNLLIYLNAEVQKKLMFLFHYSLNPGGYLMLGNSETVGSYNLLFSPAESKFRVFIKNEALIQPESLDFPSSFSHTGNIGHTTGTQKTTPENLQLTTEQILLQQYVPAAVLVNLKGDILYINGRTGKYLEPAAGKANWNIHAMAREGLRHELSLNLQKVIRQKNSIVLHNIKVGTNGSIQTIDLTLQWIEKPDMLKGTVLIVFNEVAIDRDKTGKARKGRRKTGFDRQSELEVELQKAREEQQAALEEMQTSQEELTSSNEELQSTNEELQSTNEELTTSKEEMQSLNEELQTVNVELQSKVDELSRSNNDMKNLLNSTDIATLFLDNWLNIRRFTTQVTKIISLLPGDVGRPVTDLSSDLNYPDLVADSNEVLRTLVTSEKAVSTFSGTWFNVKIMPYRTIDSKIDGVVITFTDITRAKKLEACYQKTSIIVEQMIMSSSNLVISLSADGRITEFNPAAEIFFGCGRDEVLDEKFVNRFVPSPLLKKTEAELKELMRNPVTGRFTGRLRRSGNEISPVNWAVCSLLDNNGEVSGLIFIGQELIK